MAHFEERILFEEYDFITFARLDELLHVLTDFSLIVHHVHQDLTPCNLQ